MALEYTFYLCNYNMYTDNTVYAPWYSRDCNLKKGHCYMVKDNAFCSQIYDIVVTALEAGFEMVAVAAEGKYDKLCMLNYDLLYSLDTIKPHIEKWVGSKEINYALDLMLDNVKVCSMRLAKYIRARSPLCVHKIQFELIPFLEDLHLFYYFYGFIYPDAAAMDDFYNRKTGAYILNPYIEESAAKDEYKYDVSILVVGYNKLEYTTKCVESLLRNVPENMNYELILLNNGSSDDTKTYFNTIVPTKQLDVAHNYASPFATYRVYEGRYQMTISNDVLITKNSIANMFQCISSDENISWVVPATANICNYQSIDIGTFENDKEMFVLAEKNNVLNPRRWEQRARLCNPLDIKRSKDFFLSDCNICKNIFTNPIIEKNAFPDDKISLFLRRANKKMIWQKDAYCYHYGSVTIKQELKDLDEKTKTDSYMEGRDRFKKKYGIDPWGLGFCYNHELFLTLDCCNDGEVNVLGINCGMGSTPLKIKEKIWETTGNRCCHIYNITDDKVYEQDLQGVSDTVSLIFSENELYKAFSKSRYDYIILEGSFGFDIEKNKLIKELLLLLKQNGIFLVSEQSGCIDNLSQKINVDTSAEKWAFYKAP